MVRRLVQMSCVRRIVMAGFCVAVMLLSPRATAGAPPTVTFDDEGAEIHGRPAGKFAWLSVVHEQHGRLMKVDAPRGLAVASQGGSARVAMKKARTARAIWLVADLENGSSAVITPPGYEPSATPVPIEAKAGQASVAITAPVARVLYIRPGAGAWAFSGTDGGPADGDGDQNAVVTVPLSALEAVHGNAAPPATTQPGDVILAIDSRWMRVGRTAVAQ